MTLPGILATMRAMVLEAPGTLLVPRKLPVPVPAADQVLIRVAACGICRTDLHIVDGELPHPKLPLVPGHEIVGRVIQVGASVTTLHAGDTVGVPWLGYTCGQCVYCRKGKENLCENAGFTGYTIDGGYAEYTVADARYCFPVLETWCNAPGAPLLCAGLIGYRSYSMVPADAQHIGLYGFGAAAHILIQVAVAQGKSLYAFTRQGDKEAQHFALQLGAVWAGDSTEPSPVPLDAGIIFAPVGALVPKALADACKGGVIICGGIHMSDIPSFPYNLLWHEKVVRSVANLTRRDGTAFLELVSTIPVQTTTQSFPLEQANAALEALRNGSLHGAAVLVME